MLREYIQKLWCVGGGQYSPGRFTGKSDRILYFNKLVCYHTYSETTEGIILKPDYLCETYLGDPG